MSMFGQAKDMYKMQKQAKEIKKKLKNIHIEAESNGITVVMSAEQEIVSVDIPEELLAAEKKSLVQSSLIEALKKATKKAQEVSALEMRSIMGDMGFPGVGQ